MTITVYTFEGRNGEHDEYYTQDYAEAKAHAADNRLRIIANEYEWADSEMVDDYTGADETEEADEYETV